MSTRREFLKGIAGLAFLAACGPKDWTAGKLEEQLSGQFIDAKGNITSVQIDLYTERVKRVSAEALARMANFYAERGGVLPQSTTIFLTDQDLPVSEKVPEAVALTNNGLDLIIISLGRIAEQPSVYGFEQRANGALAAEMCNLMFSESNSPLFGVSPTRENRQKICDSTGFMVEAIRAGKTYEEYLEDANSKVAYQGVKGGIWKFDETTYQDFQQALESPILEFN